MQKRIVRKLELEMFLSQIVPHPSPKPSLEQYTIPANVAATMLHIAAYSYGGIVGRTVLDLGCGTGRLALGAAFLGAKRVVGIDIDKNAVKVAFENSVKSNLKEKVQWITGDIDAVRGKFDAVLQNPPFGVQRRKADRRFLEKALETGKIVYSLHKCSEKDRALIKKMKTSKTNVASVPPSSFLEKFIEKCGGKTKAVYAVTMTIPHMFNFHIKKKHEFVVNLFVIERK